MGIHCPVEAEFKRSATQWISVFAGMAKVFNFFLTLTTYHLTKLLFINIFDFFFNFAYNFFETKGIWLRDRKKVRKSVDVRIVAYQIRRCNIAAHNVPFVMPFPAWSGGCRLYNRRCPKAGGVITDL